MIDKAKRLLREDKVDYKYSNDKVSVWEVKDEKEYKLIADRDFDISCTCLYGLGRGTEKGLCPHQLAVLFYLSKNYNSFKEREEDKEIEVQKDRLKQGGFGFKLKGKHKKWLRNNIPCEVCGSKPPNTIHRLKRGNKEGEYVLRNIQVICSDCDSDIHFAEKGTINR